KVWMAVSYPCVNKAARGRAALQSGLRPQRSGARRALECVRVPPPLCSPVYCKLRPSGLGFFVLSGRAAEEGIRRGARPLKAVATLAASIAQLLCDPIPRG